MKKLIAFVPIIIGLLVLGGLYVRGGFPFNTESLPGIEMVPTSPTASPSASILGGYKIEKVAGGLFVPWSLVFTSKDRFLVTERSGAIKEVISGKLSTDPVYVFKDVSPSGEAGLMSITKSPHYEEDKSLFTCVSYTKNKKLVSKVVRLMDQGKSLILDKIILDDIPAAANHAGCGVKFGPDGMLYVTTGDATQKNLAQDKNSLAGKVLRLTLDGGIPPDNPFQNSLVYALGFRNSQSIEWTDKGEIYAVDHGPSGFDGPVGGDEINHIVKGENYGWPLVSHDESSAGLKSPLRQFTPAIAPASIAIYKGEAYVGMLKGEGILRVKFDPNDPDKILSATKLPDVEVGRVRDVVVGPDGNLYFTTSNRDGRGKPRDNDDSVYRLIPQ